MSGDQTPKNDYRATLNLPKTDFPMRGDLPKREPARVAWWQEHRSYERRLERNAAGGRWILHDGPPYANGAPHMGSFLNRVLKDVFVKVHLLDGKFANFVPGWDMHGLPIEFETLKHLKLDFRTVDPIELRAKCRAHALHWLDVQRAAFVRMGTFGDYDHPYRTIDAGFEAVIVETLADLADAGQLYKGLRSTLWCIHDETALAEAEIEYKDRISPSIYVRFRADEAQRADLLARAGVSAAGDVPLSVLIWTTTPWTLPANVAIALKPEAEYGIYRRGDELLLVADRLAESVFALSPGPAAERVGGAQGSAFVGGAVRHPFFDRDSALVGADYVELETGTGAVHTAPGHGADDFDTGMKFGLPILNPVDARGIFTSEAGPYAGLRIFNANPTIVADLRASGALFADAELEHSYPHCWRCKNPVIFRATSQWFIALDVNRLRKRVEERIPDIRWHPTWGENRMYQTIASHPEWCISRQRTWGTPIPAIVCRGCGESVLDSAVARNVARAFRERGSENGNASDVWWTEPLATFLPEGFACRGCGATEFDKEFNIVDIWFESGVTHRAVLKGRDDLHWPADLYLEGSDQYRGWFRSNLVTAVATMGAPPTKAIVSAGWVVDSEGRAMHKSAGNYVAATEAMNTYGADVLRLWTAAVEFTADMRFGDEIVGAVGSVYRNFRYRLRMLLGLLDGLTPERLIERADLRPLDRLALARLDDVAHAVVRAYREFRLHDVYLALIAFDDELSGFYIDALKEPLYTGAPDGARRRSGQSAAFAILRSLCALLAPILSFTAEEAWQSVPETLRGNAESVFDLPLPHGSERGTKESEELSFWETLKRLRGSAAAAEGMRDFQLQGIVHVPPAMLPRFSALGDDLREALIVSAVRIEDDVAPDGQPWLQLEPAAGGKCARCWKTRPLGADPAHPVLCAQCAEIVNALPR
ncbi:MAG: isoleucine--tRNA ligase [Candidatus Eremiobacteraeota bacterium]|nr:isoleucine--tRNA ligase [Candidatus Eremiobacteraeota bacterium]